jgi:hypothetical protein
MKEETKLDWYRFAATVLIVILTALTMIAATWYSMYRVIEAQQYVAASKDREIESLQKFASKYGESFDTTSKSFCEKNLNGNTSLGAFNYFENADGKYVSCGTTQDNSGAVLIGKLVNGEWQKVFSGNGEIPKDTIDKYKLPCEIQGPGACQSA